ncbi:type II toxin-antitoxin system HipA family toxin [Bradyrhizobium sp.]|uniref:type II toxin-antitoxin system HipA family toxin n=1 Tax=Bradyrhizobium sp. TaxID=376 RepID=UPI003C201B22
MTDRSLLVHVDLKGTPHLVGRLWARSRKGKESATFEYDAGWLDNPLRFALEPALTLGKGPHHAVAGRLIIGAIGDSAPDRWGRGLIQRDERRKAREEKRTPRTLLEADFLLGVGDIARQGALRFNETEGGPFLATGVQIPPLIQLPALLGAAMRMSEDGGSDDDLRLLLAPGSSLGGARPKASVVDKDGQLAIAKFPQHGDLYRVSLWEALALKLAGRAGIPTPDWRVEKIADRDVLLLRRFDRLGNERIPFLSAMSLLNAADNEPHSYMEIADALRQHGAKADDDCAQLWRRIVFSILISNSDDHLRNHGFLYETAGWRLSPAYDMNPVPVDIKPRILTTAIDEVDGTASLDLAFQVAPHFGVKSDKAKSIVREVGAAVAHWRETAAGLGLAAAEIERMASAFDHADTEQANAG